MPHQGTVRIAGIIGRVATSIVVGSFLVIPLAVLSAGLVKRFQLIILSVCIVLFSLIVDVLLKVSEYEMMVISAACALILSVFVSNNSDS